VDDLDPGQVRGKGFLPGFFREWAGTSTVSACSGSGWISGMTSASSKKRELALPRSVFFALLGLGGEDSAFEKADLFFQLRDDRFVVGHDRGDCTFMLGHQGSDDAFQGGGIVGQRACVHGSEFTFIYLELQEIF
jgi:hypothetical protein